MLIGYVSSFVLCESVEKYEWVGQDMILRDSEPQIRTSYDNMEAFMKLPIPDTGNPYSVEELVDFLAVKGVVQGIDEDMISKMVNDKIYMQERRVAVGKDPVEGHDGNYEFFFNRTPSRAPKELPDGSVDYYTMNLIATVGANERIAVYHPCVQGENGYNIKGAPLTAKRCRDLPPLKGKGFHRSEDGLEYFADIDGKIDYSTDRVTVSPVYEVQQDMDIRTGNIDFNGDVVIHGSVRTGMTIKASGTVTIDGIVENATIIAGKDVVLKSGLMGNSQAVIQTKGNLFAKFVEYASLDVRGTINAEVLLNCDVVCGEKVLITSKRGYIVGGTLRAISGVEANGIGNDIGVKTSVAVGAEVEVYRRLKVLEHKIQTTERNMEMIDEQIREVERESAPKSVMDRPKANPRKVSLLRMKIRENTNLQEAKVELEELQSIVSRADGAIVSVLGSVYPGTTVRIDDIIHHVREEQFSVEFVKHVDRIYMERRADAIF